MSRQLHRVRVDQYAPQFAADHGNLARILDPAELVLDLVGQSAQIGCVIDWVAGGQGEGDNRHIVDFNRFHRPVFDTGGDDILVGHQFVPNLDQAVFAVFAHIEAHRDHGLAFAGGGIDVFHAVHFAQFGFQRRGGEFFHLFRRRAGHLNEHIRHRHDDLRLLFARGQQQSSHARQQRGD